MRFWRHCKKIASRLWRAGLDMLFPPLCASCRAPVADVGHLCAACWGNIAFIDGPCCFHCGLPFELDPGGETLCAGCHADPPDFDRAVSLMLYDTASRKLVLALKWADRLDLSPAFARWLERGGRAVLAESDIIIPVPLHPRRLWRRRYNQSALIAQALAGLVGRHYAPMLLRRIRATPSQGSMATANARRLNMRGAFQVAASGRSRLAGRNILLIDDVLTTGATLNACARSLKKAGAARVYALTLARVVR